MIKKFNIMGVHWKIRFFFVEEGGSGAWKGVFEGGRGESPKKGAWIAWRFKRRLGKRMGYVFEMGGVETSMHNMSWTLPIETKIQSK